MLGAKIKGKSFVYAFQQALLYVPQVVKGESLFNLLCGACNSKLSVEFIYF